jgi:UPF0271 protein
MVETARRVDLNADMGESFGPWPMGDDAALLEIVTSANIACGFHAGDPDVMAATMGKAVAAGVGLGAHPGFRDLQGFGRNRMHVPYGTLANAVAYQFGAARGMARAAGGAIRHLKLHGAMANMASEDLEMAKRIYDGALSVDPEVILTVMVGTAQEAAARTLGARFATEAFADRAYEASGHLVDRRKPGAMIHEPAAATDRVLSMLETGTIPVLTGGAIEAQIDTICLHGDSAAAVALARALREGLTEAGVVLEAFPGQRG